MGGNWLICVLVSLCFLRSLCQEGCREAGMASCCTTGNCQVSRSLGNCFCDNMCHSRRDCCHDIEFICPQATGDAGGSSSQSSGDTEFGSGDTELGSGSENLGSGDMTDTMTTTVPTTPIPDQPPLFTRPPVSNFYLINPASSDRRLFISLGVDYGHPVGLLSWTHNGSVVSSHTDPRVSVLASGSLTIRNVRFSDAGQYRLLVSNRAGNLSHDFTVRSQFLEISTAYGVVFQSRNTVGFGCVARSYPFIYFRKWNVSSTGERLNSSRVDIFPSGSGERLMQALLTNVDPVDCIRRGVYSCEFASGPTIYHNSVSAQIKCPVEPVQVNFLETLYVVTEGTGVVSVCLNSSFTRQTVSTVNVSLSVAHDVNASAQYGLDYNVSLGSFTISLATTELCFSVTIIDDFFPEKEEEFSLILTANDALSIVSNSNITTIRIQDNDVLDLVFEESMYEVSETIANRSLHLALQVCVTRGDHPQPLTGHTEIHFLSFSGTARGGLDYMPIQAKLDIDLADEQLRVCECVNLLPDNYSEGEETFEVSVISPSSGNIMSTARVKIIDDEYVHASIEKSEYTVTEGGAPLEVCVTLQGNLSTTIVLYLCTQNKTAQDVADYAGLTSHRIEFVPSNSSVQKYCRSVPIRDDVLFEEREVFTLELMSGPQNPAGMVKVTPHDSATVTILDNEVASAVFVNGTPSIIGRDVFINFVNTGSFEYIDCTLKGPGKSVPITSSCTSGSVVFPDVPLRYQQFVLNVTGTTPEGTTLLLLQRHFRLDSPVCSVHLINDGVRTTGPNSVSIEWAATGPSPTSKVSRFMCMKDRIRTKFECTSPVVWQELSPGAHRLIVEPMPTPGCRRHVPQTFHFSL